MISKWYDSRVWLLDFLTDILLLNSLDTFFPWIEDGWI